MIRKFYDAAIQDCAGPYINKTKTVPKVGELWQYKIERQSPTDVYLIKSVSTTDEDWYVMKLINTEKKHISYKIAISDWRESFTYIGGPSYVKVSIKIPKKHNDVF